MKVRDKNLKEQVDVAQKECVTFTCYWPRQNPGSLLQGRGYRSYGDARKKEWLCGNREIQGCPVCPQVKVRDNAK